MTINGVINKVAPKTQISVNGAAFSGINGIRQYGYDKWGMTWNGNHFAPPDVGSVLYLPGVPGAGSTILDYSSDYILHFTGSATSNVNCTAIHNAAAKLWVSLWFRLDSSFAGGAPADMYIWGKQLDGTNRLRVWLESTNGTINYRLQLGGAVKFTIASVETSWNANQWYHIIFSISSAEGARLIVDNGGAQTNVNVDAAPNGGDFVIGVYDDPGAGNGFIGEIKEVTVGTDDLSGGEEAGLYAGTRPGDEDNYWDLHEGTGTTAHDSAGSDDGTIDSANVWEGTGTRRGNDGTIVGATYRQLPTGLNYLDFDGSDDKITVGAAATFKFLHGAEDTSNFKFTIKFWMFVTSFTDDYWGLVGTNDVDSLQTGTDLWLDNRSGIPRTRRLMAAITNSSGTTIVFSDAGNSSYPNDASWHHIVWSYDQTPATGNSITYVDTTAKSTDNKSAQTPDTGNPTRALVIGRVANDGSHYGGIALPVIIKDVAWTQAQITDNRNQERHLFGV